MHVLVQRRDSVQMVSPKLFQCDILANDSSSAVKVLLRYFPDKLFQVKPSNMPYSPLIL